MSNYERSTREIRRPDRHLIERARRYSSATLHEASGQRGALPSAIKPIAPEFKICGPAVTVLSPPRDNLWLHRALYVAVPGDVLVVDVGSVYEAGYWGDVLTQAAMQRGLGGLVIDGCVRDGERLRELGLPIFSRGLCIKGTTKDKAAVGAINCPIRIGEVPIFAGDLAVADGDGAVIISQDDINKTLNQAEAREEKEEQVLHELYSGKRTLELYKLD
jgi:4-hydroxy-4-methyl-2-oxoglutarate aldolase